VGDAPLDELDGRVIVDVLRGDGWRVSEVAVTAAAVDVAAQAAAEHVQLVVMPTSNAENLLLSAATYTQLRRLPDPPLIVACSFGRPDDTRRARAAGADGFVNDPDALLQVIARRLPGKGVRNWGVRLRRLGATLVVAPTGDLDAGSVGRLRDVVSSRDGTFDGLVVDTRDVASVSVEGLEALLAWVRSDAGAPRRLVPGPLVSGALAGAPLEARLLAVPADAGA
jgi:CheY-like chemotaxis protein